MPFPFRRRYDLPLVSVDLAVAYLASETALRLRFEGALSGRFEHAYYLANFFLLPLWVVAARWSGLYKRTALRPGTSNLETAFSAAITTGVLLAVANVLFLRSDLSRGWLVIATFALVLLAVASRTLIRWGRRFVVPFGVGHEKYLLIGDSESTRRLRDDLTRAPGAPFQIIGVLDAQLTPSELAVEARAHGVDGLVLSSDAESGQAASLAEALSGSGIDVLVAPSFGELQSRVASIAMLQGVPLLRVAGLAPRRPAVRVKPRDRTRHGVAVLGTRGVPANYGGFETFAERLSLQLVERGITPTVYCRSHYATEQSPWRGISLVTLPTIKSKYFDTVVHTALSALHLVVSRGPRDVVLCNAANAPVLLLLRLFRRRVVLNVDGLEWRRSKWGMAGRAWYRLGEWLSVRLAAVLVTDAYEVQTYYRVRHDTDSAMIPYGADLLTRGAAPVPADVPVEPGRFALYVSRWERENNPLMVARAHASLGDALQLVMLGSATYDEELAREVAAAASTSAVLPGAVFGDGYRGLQCNALCYIHATEVGGTHPALIEAMGAGNLVLVLDTPENREVAGQAAVFFADEHQLVERLRWVAGLGAAELEEWRSKARALAAERYSWPAVADSYVELLRGTSSH